jgi:olfactory receptor
MNPRLCVLMVLVSCILSVLHSLLQSLMVLRLSFCTDLEIPHFVSLISWFYLPVLICSLIMW